MSRALHPFFSLLPLLLVAAPVPAAERIVIGEIDSRTGQFAAQGSAIHQGVTLAIEEANARGGIAGRTLLLLSRDDEGKPERAVAAAEELTGQHGALALVGGYVDSLVGPVAEVADRGRAPYVAAASLDERLTAHGNRYFFREGEGSLERRLALPDGEGPDRPSVRPTAP